MSSVNIEPRLPALHSRIRRRRAQIGLTGTQLGHRAGISASYVSVIENGAKVPEEGVAAALARALGDDEALYRAWARAARLGVHDLALLNELAAIARTPALASLVESGEALPAASERHATDDELAGRLREVAFRIAPAPARVVAVPLFDEGADPAGRRPAGDQLLLDSRLLAGIEPQDLFAYEIAAATAGRLRGVVAAGDRLVLSRGAPVRPDRVSAVRTGGSVVLACALVSERTVLLLPGDGESETTTLRLAGGQSLDEVVAGTQVLLVRG